MDTCQVYIHTVHSLQLIVYQKYVGRYRMCGRNGILNVEKNDGIPKKYAQLSEAEKVTIGGKFAEDTHQQDLYGIHIYICATIARVVHHARKPIDYSRDAITEACTFLRNQ